MILLVTEHEIEEFQESLLHLDDVQAVAACAIPRPHSLESAVREALHKQTFTLAVVMVEGGGGLSLCKAIKEATSAPPVIWISEDDGYEHWAEKIGVEDFWVQPMPAKLLQKQADYFLKEKTNK